MFILKDANSIYTNHFGSVTIWLISRSRGRFYLGSPWPRFYQYFSFKLAHFYTKKFTWSLPLHEVKHPNGQDKFDDLFESLVKIKLEPWQIRLIYIYYCGRKRHDLYILEFFTWLRLRCQHGQGTEWGLTETKFSQNWYWGSVSENVGESQPRERMCNFWYHNIFRCDSVSRHNLCYVSKVWNSTLSFIETFHEIYKTFVN